MEAGETETREEEATGISTRANTGLFPRIYPRPVRAAFLQESFQGFLPHLQPPHPSVKIPFRRRSSIIIYSSPPELLPALPSCGLETSHPTPTR